MSAHETILREHIFNIPVAPHWQACECGLAISDEWQKKLEEESILIVNLRDPAGRLGNKTNMSEEKHTLTEADLHEIVQQSNADQRKVVEEYERIKSEEIEV